MKMILKRIACLLVLCLSMCLITGSAETESFETFAEKQYRTRGIVGGAVVISLNGETLASYTYGRVAKSKKSDPVTIDTCFRIASVTKMVTAVGLVKLMEEKDLSYDTPISDLLGFSVFNPNYPDIPITVRQVMTHTTGFTATTDRYLTNFEKLKKDTTIFVKKCPPGSKFVYSNRNGGMMGALIEALSGQSLNTYMKENLFDPLGINAAYHPALLEDQSDISNRLNTDGDTVQTVSKALDTFSDYHDVCDPYNNRDISVGGLYISARGLDRFLNLLVQDGTWNGEQILPDGIREKMTADQAFEGSSVLVEGKYALSLERVTDLPGGVWYGHQGMLGGLSADAYFQPDTGLCVTVIANGYEPVLLNGIAKIARAFMEYAETLLPEKTGDEL